MVADIRSHAPSHVALTGDVVNLSAVQEFRQAALWLQSFGPPDWISLVPGNHDAYVPVPWKSGLSHLAPYMAGSMVVENPLVTTYNAQPFPYVRFKGNLALIGLTTAVPQSLRSAGGSLGQQQLQRLTELLEDAKRKGCYRCIMIHHPPMPGLAPPRKALTDAAEFCAVVQDFGAELVLHGHNHRNSLNWITAATGNIPVIGVASATMQPGDGHNDAASWNLFRINREKGRWNTKMTRRSYDLPSKSFADAGHYTLSP